jgi:hypothetical protein
MTRESGSASGDARALVSGSQSVQRGATSKAAGAQESSVVFGVRLHRSLQWIDLTRAPRDPIFRSYTVYTTRERQDGREWFELRLGFFRDEAGAEQVARYLRNQFAAASVVTTTAQEHQAALRAARRLPPVAGFTSAVKPTTFTTRSSNTASSNTITSNAASKPATPSALAVAARETGTNTPRLTARPPSNALEDSLRSLATEEIGVGEEDLGSTTVRHLKIEVQRKDATRTAKVIRWRFR